MDWTGLFSVASSHFCSQMQNSSRASRTLVCYGKNVKVRPVQGEKVGAENGHKK